MNIEKTDFLRPVPLGDDCLGPVRIGKSRRGHPGAGSVDFPALRCALAAMGDHQEVLRSEDFSLTLVERNLSNALSVSCNLRGKGTGLARHVRRFMIDGISAAHAA